MNSSTQIQQEKRKKYEKDMKELSMPDGEKDIKELSMPDDKKGVKELSMPDDEKEITRLLRDDPNFKLCVNNLLEMKKQLVLQNNDAHSVFLRPKCRMTPAMFTAYPDSPTAQRYMEAFDFFLYGWLILKDYNKDVVDNENDCDFLQPAFHAYSYGEMTEQHLFSQFQPPENTSNLINQYLKLRSRDVLTQYFKTILVFNPNLSKYKSENFSDFDFQKTKIVTGEEFIHQRLSYADLSGVDRSMLKSLYYQLGAVYVTTFQVKRALDSFQKCYDLDKTNVSALYGIACQYRKKDPERAIKLLLQFIDRAPDCDKQYPNAHYQLAHLYLEHYKNDQEAMRYCNLAERAEKKRLSFLYPVDIPQKRMVQMFKSIYQE